MSRMERRSQLLAIASDMVRADGLAALTMARLAENAAIAKPVVYSHFPSARHVAIALIDDHFAAVGRHFDERVSDARTLPEFIEAMVESAYAFVSETPILNITNGFTAGDDVNQAYLRHEADFRQLFETLLRLVGAAPARVSVASAVLPSMIGSAIAASGGLTVDEDKRTLVIILMAALNALAADGGRRSVTGIIFKKPISQLIRENRKAGACDPILT